MAARDEGHAFCTDDAESGPAGRDPSCNTFDATADPLQFFTDRTTLIDATKARERRGETFCFPLIHDIFPFPGSRLQERLLDQILARNGTDWSAAYPLVRGLIGGTSYGALAAAKYVGGHVMGSERFTGQAAAAFRLVSAAEQRSALRYVARVLTGDSLYLNGTDYPRLSVKAYSYNGKRWYDDPGTLGRRARISPCAFSLLHCCWHAALQSDP